MTETVEEQAQRALREVDNEYQSILTSLNRQIDFVNSDDFNRTTLTQANVRQERLEDLWNKFNASHLALTRISSGDDRPGIQDRLNEIEERHFDALAAIKDKQAALAMPPLPAPGHADGANGSNPAAPVFQLKIPIEQGNIPNTWGHFDGNFLEWKRFRDRYTDRIHSKPETEIATSYKLGYLTSSLKGKAKDAVSGWSIENEGYSKIWERLNELYNEKYPLAREYLKEFSQLRTVQGSSAAEFRNLSNVTNKMIRTLASEGFPVEHWDMIIVHHLHGRLDEETARQWELLRGMEMPTATQILEFIDKQAKAASSSEQGARANVQVTVRNKSSDCSNQPSYHQPSSSQAAASSGAASNTDTIPKKLKCGACEKYDHPLYYCPFFLSLDLNAKKDFVARRNHCSNCLRKGHPTEACTDVKCNLPKCSLDNRHNSTMCPYKLVKKPALASVIQQVSSDAEEETRYGPSRTTPQRKAKASTKGTKRQGHSLDGPETRSKKRKSDKKEETELANRLLFKEKMDILNGKLDLLDKKEILLKESFKNVKENKRKFQEDLSIVTKKSTINKPSNWPFEAYSNMSELLKEDCYAILPTVMVVLSWNNSTFGPVRAVLDTGAQMNLISFALFRKLACQSWPTSKRLVGIDGKPFYIRRKTVFKVLPWYQDEADTFVKDNFWILPEGSNWQPIMPARQLNVVQGNNTLQMRLADPEYFMPSPVYILLGVNFFAKIIRAVTGTCVDGSTLLETTLGIVVMGAHSERLDEVTGVTMPTIEEYSEENNLEELLQRLWKMDEIGTSSTRTQEEELVEKHFMDTHKRDENGKFIVSIPIKENINNIGSSRDAVIRRFLHIERRLEENLDLKEFYTEQMRDAIRTGQMKLVTRNAAPDKICYHIPHHCVLKKPRVVYDASCKTNMGVSLNEVQMLGEKLQKDLSEIMMRFRRHKYAVCGDIREMYNQVKLNEDQWDMLRIFWRENKCDPLREYWLTVLTFRLKSSGYIAVRCVMQAAREAEERLHEASNAILNDFYMDDCATGASTEGEAIELAGKIDEILKGAGFTLCKWKSNSSAVLNAMDSESESSMVFSEEGATSILRLKWLIGTDQFTFEVKTPEVSEPLTKRKIVSCVAQLYDPNGYISPVIVTGKILIQRLWKEKLDWDEILSEEIKGEWNKLWSEIILLEKFRIDRWIGLSEDTKVSLMGFCDSSEAAYGAIIFARVEYPNGDIACNLLVSKTRVAPLKTVSIPRLELSAAELMGRLVTEFKKTMGFSSIDYTLWIDSSPALYWIRKSPCNLKTFVANRVTSIQDNTDIKCWRYVNTKENPADLLSRGALPSELINNDLWLHGPKWLSRPELEWPKEKFPLFGLDKAEDELKVYSLIRGKPELDISLRSKGKRVPLLEYHSTLERALNISAYVIRYINARRAKYKPPARGLRSVRSEIHPPTVQEKTWAMEYFIRKSQQMHYGKEIAGLSKGKGLPERSRIESLKPMLDDKGILRVGGRLEKSELAYDMKHRAIIPNGSRLGWLILEFAHRQTKHGGVQLGMQYLRQKYWIPKLRNEKRLFIHNCVMCVRYNYRLQKELMASLPADRVRPGKPFLHSGVDYAGPFEVKVVDREGDAITTTKSWVAVFVCLKTRAVHLDIVTELSSAAFLACYERFIGRRGRCERMYSDNGTSFVGAEKEIRKAYAAWKNDETMNHLARKGTEWSFMTPAAPHQGGIYEAAVKSMKHHLKRIVGIKKLPYEQFMTLLIQIEAILNSRPIHPLSDDPEDIQALTPGHFLISESFIAPPAFDHPNKKDIIGIQLWKQRQEMLSHFWNRWENEYLTTLQERKEWRREKEPLKIGQLVLLKSENFPPAQWGLGRIWELLPDAKGIVRNVIVRTANGKLKRAVQKICIVPVEESVCMDDCGHTHSHQG